MIYSVPWLTCRLGASQLTTPNARRPGVRRCRHGPQASAGSVRRGPAAIT